jgi:hypothetical protein
MTSRLPTAPPPGADTAGPYRGLQREVAILAGRFAELLRRRFADDASAVEVALHFLDYRYREACGDTPLDAWSDDCLGRLAQQAPPTLQRLIDRLGLDRLSVELLLVAGMTEEHEGYADIFRSLHPGGHPFPTFGLVAQLLCPEAEARLGLRHRVEATPDRPWPLFRSDAESPFFTRSLRLTEGLWSWLLGVECRPDGLNVERLEPVGAGLAGWLARAEVRRAERALRAGRPVTLLITGERLDAALNRAAVLCRQAGLEGRRLPLTADPADEGLRRFLLHCLLHGRVPVLALPPGGKAPALTLGAYPAPIIVCADADGDTGGVLDARPLQCLTAAVPDVDGLRTMWRQLLPELADQADHLAARYPFEPAQAQRVCNDLRQGGEADPPITLAGVARAVHARSAGAVAAGIQLIPASADWSQLVLPEAQLIQLQDAASRLYLQSRVLDDWRFLQGRRGARGVRLLFSGPPGTGKTLSAEVLATAMGVDLLQVDLSRVVSKWIGETEKNLAQVFSTAESSRAVLFFDEADVLFGKRTEVSDAHDRYANLETAYLLSRLERYEGLAILATNFRQNIDSAFSRRLEYIIEFEEPGYGERLRLWQCHIPDQAPLAEDVSLAELASQFPIVGGYIRNAALSAAFFAAREQGPITQRHLFEAIRREYEKSGKAYREVRRHEP